MLDLNASKTTPNLVVVLFIICAAFVALTLGASLARAQTIGNEGFYDLSPSDQATSPPTPYAIQKKTNEFGIWGGSTSDSPTIIGGSKNRKLPLIVGLRYGRIIYAGKGVAIQYTFDVIPAAVASQPVSVTGRTRVFGAGLFPVGFKLLFRAQEKVKPFVEISSGPVYFTRPVPVPGAARLNFISNIRGGLQIFTLKRRAVTIGYDISHLSNAGISNINPGFNLNYIYVGFSIFK